jgi:hypothetical protein
MVNLLKLFWYIWELRLIIMHCALIVIYAFLPIAF